MKEGWKPKVFAVAASRPTVREVLCRAIEQVGEGMAKALPLDDFGAVMAVRSGQADYFIGCCEDGLSIMAVPVAFLGKERCATVATPASPPVDLDVYAEINRGVVAFGFAEKQIANSLNLLVPALLEEGGDAESAGNR